MRNFVKISVSLGLLLLLIAPLLAIFALSRAEVRQYEAHPVPPLANRAYGELCRVERIDLPETVSVSGEFISGKKFFMELPKQKNPYGVRMLIGEGDEIAEGQLIGHSEDLATDIYATASGIVQGITIGNISYITLESMEDLVFECQADDDTAAILMRDNINLASGEGEPVEVLSISRRKNEQGKTRILLSVPNGIYGQRIDGLLLYTGRIFYQALVIDSRCVFQMNDDKKKWYVRTVDANGNYLELVEVKVSYTSGELVAISGVSEGTLCDSGYKKLMEDD